ncbi:hypothetical protein [Nocardioides euryhalodurans]|uniref:Uncharacterized protein n=1 Tax=Nocardioides euryhalodurans TaxID=2518370 RepID=A0A4P7GIX5_9ACTN|nr:hypothetical protein [Nocardioides euryhalodurans]QBR91571.1 hypothetical protein EXE57_04265 [Nocardioides euryhalodurans]
MSATTKTLLAAALTLPLVAFVAGVLASPAEVEDDRSRPVIIGRVSDDSGVRSPGPDGGRDDRDDRTAREDRDDRRDDDDDGPTGDDGSEDPPEAPATEPFTVVTPAPRDLDGDDDGGDDDDDDGDAGGDDTDDESGDD